MNDRESLRSLTVALALTAFSALAQAQYTGLYTFNGNYDGESPYYADLMAQGPDWNLHGTLPVGSLYAQGSWFDYTIGGGVTIHPLKSGQPYNPYAGLTLGLDGNYYGASIHSTNGSSYGELFKVASSVTTTGGTITPVPVYTFTGGTNGSYPYAPPVQGPDGNLYGVTNDPGSTGYVYQVLTATGTLGWIHQLPSASRAPLIFASDGNLYGTYPYGGMTINGVGAHNSSGGGIFRVTLSGVMTGIYNIDPFDPSTNVNGGKGDGCGPWGPVMQAADGYLYGTAKDCGSAGGGVIYKVALDGSGFNVVHNFQFYDGTEPEGGLVQGSDMFLYGMTSNSGLVVYPYVPSGSFFKTDTTGVNFVNLFDFTRASGANGVGSGSYPAATPTLHTSGVIYGLTLSGGTSVPGATTYGTYDDGGELFSYRAGLHPFISIVGVRSGHVGGWVGILGQGFLSATGVSFGGVSVPWTKQSVTIWSNNYMTVTIPLGAKTGIVTVTTPKQSFSTLYNFTIACSGPLCNVRLP